LPGASRAFCEAKMDKMFCVQFFDGETYKQEYFLCAVRAALKLELMQRTDKFAEISTLDLDTRNRNDDPIA
jgi:hypothetical protein